jgi:hypothetical protein
LGLDRLIAAVVAVGVAVACGGQQRPLTLVDGTRAVAPPPQLPRNSILSRTEIVPWSDLLDALRSSCPGLRPELRVVERTGIDGASVTFRDSDEPGLLACDMARGSYELDPWCGFSAGRLVDGRLVDPRLDLCQTPSGEVTAFAWVEPMSDARWVGVDQGSYSELYEVAADLPVRIASTRDVHLEGSRASFDVTQYDENGREVAMRTVEAAVAG